MTQEGSATIMARKKAFVLGSSGSPGNSNAEKPRASGKATNTAGTVVSAHGDRRISPSTELWSQKARRATGGQRSADCCPLGALLRSATPARTSAGLVALLLVGSRETWTRHTEDGDQLRRVADA